MSGRALIDSNILVYAFDATDAKKYNRAESFLRSAIENKNAVLSAQNLAEFYVNITMKKKGVKGLTNEYAGQIVQDFTDSFSIITYDAETVLDSIAMQMDCGIHFWDALLASTMLANNIKVIYTENTKDFSKVQGIQAINPLI